MCCFHGKLKVKAAIDVCLCVCEQNYIIHPLCLLADQGELENQGLISISH